MLFIKESEKAEIRKKIQQLPPIFKNQNMTIFCFEALGTLILAYGICVSQYKHPISREEPNPYWTFLISCFLYLGISAAAPFTGGHLNPSVTLGTTVAGISNKEKIIVYMVSQIFGALVGVLIYNIFLGNPPEIYAEEASIRDIILDAVGEAFGTFLFLFGIIYAVKRDYMQGQYFKYFFIVLMLLVGRTFSFRQGCLNPAVGIALQFFAAVHHHDGALLANIIGIVAGSLLGGVIAAIFFNYFYEPLLKELDNKN